MSRKYKFADDSKPYFVTFTVINWIDLFIRDAYKNIIIDSLKYCQEKKDFELYGWCIMTSHIHLIIGTAGNPLPNIMRDLKRHTSEELHKSILNNQFESRKRWMIWMMQNSAKKNNIKSGFQLWQAESHPLELSTAKIASQKLAYIHNNPVAAGFVEHPEDWLYSSARNYIKNDYGLLNIKKLDMMTL